MLRRKQFLDVAKGLSAPRGTVVVQARTQSDQHDTIVFGLTASRRVGNAVLRNRARRRMRHAARSCLHELGVPGNAYVFIARHSTAACPWSDLVGDMRSALKFLRRKLRDSAQLQTAQHPA